MDARKQIAELVERFDRNRDAYTGGRYNETQLRREFIDPFFAALGWDVDNRQGYAEAYKDVIHEDAIKIGAATKAPDYCFRIGGTRKFFLEAKKPSVDIKGDPGPAYQLRRYAWSAKLGLSILTDFEELAVYDCRKKPSPTDKSSKARVLFFTYKDYLERWDEIAGIFSRDAILKGSFDKFAETAKLKKGTEEVDDSFLSEIEGWRDALAHNIALRNPELNHRELNFAVQITIDRIIFLRICEDRGVEQYGALMSLLNGADIYDRLKVLFTRADERYNSGLFHFSKEKDRHDPPDELTPRLVIDDKILKDIFKKLYYPDCPFEFSVLPAEILGQVYEQFLGSTITLSAGHRAKVEYKPEVKKAGGVFYTPAYIVNYIVQNTVGKLVEGKTPAQIKAVRVLDPACGSGSFLLGAYQFLLDWYLKYYLDNEPATWAKKKNPPICACSNPLPPSPLNCYKLTLGERKRILLSHIYGVDIDSQAVEVTKLSLLLKVLEGERQLVLFHAERALPDLCDNIKCGNSLIGTDFYKNQQMALFDDEMHYKINAFDWKKEFPDVFSNKNPGFDAVVGNPPYGAFLSKNEEHYLNEKYQQFEAVKDIYVAFIQHAEFLLSNDGFFGYIVPSAWLGGPNYRTLREYMLSMKLQSVIQLPFDIFRDAYVDTLIVTAQKGAMTAKHEVATYDYPKKERIVHIAPEKLNKIRQNLWKGVEDFKFILDQSFIDIASKLYKSNARINDLYEMKRGVLFDAALLTSKKSNANSYRYFEGSIYRYQSEIKSPSWIEFGPKLKESPKEIKWFLRERLLLRRLVNRQKRLMASVVTDDFITNKNLYTILPLSNYSVKFLLGILNSKLLSRLYLSMVSQSTKDDFPQVTIKDILKLPLPTLNLDSSQENALYDKLVLHVEAMLDLQNKLKEAKTSDAKVRLERQIAATDEEIDKLVYELYGLTEEEIAIVEEA